MSQVHLDPSDPASSVRALSREVARLRRLVLLLALPWPIVMLTSFADGVQDEVVTRRLIVVDDQGVTRAELAAPIVPVRPTPHAAAVPTALPALRLLFEDGQRILLGATDGPGAQVRVDRDGAWTGIHTTGLFTVQDYGSHGEASAVLDPFALSLSWSKDDRGIDLELRGEDGPEITITEGEHETAFPPR